MSKVNTEQQIVNLVYPCIVCKNVFYDSRVTRNHMNLTHGYGMVLNPESKLQPDNDDQFTFKQDESYVYDVERFACPACSYHCTKDDMKSLRDHILQTHPFEDSDSSSEEEEEDETAESNGAAEDARNDQVDRNVNAGAEDKKSLAAAFLLQWEEIANFVKKIIE